MRSQKAASCLVLLILAALVASSAGAGVNPPKEPARVDLSVAPEAVEAGTEAHVTCRLFPKTGIKINRYPKMSLKVEAIDGLVGSAEAKVGNDAPPPIEDPESNYFKSVDPIELDLELDPAAPAGTHRIPAQLKYFYCVAASGFCAPIKTDVELEVTVR